MPQPPPDLEQFEANLKKVYDVLESSPLKGEWYLTHGLLLGLLREGHRLPWDWDIDICFLDHSKFVRTIPFLLKAGFRKRRKFLNNNGDATQYQFKKQRGLFDFMRLTWSDMWLSYVNPSYVGGNSPQILYHTLPLEPHYQRTHRYLDRDWRIPHNAEDVLTSIFGNWKVENKSWRQHKDCPTVLKMPWLHSHLVDWDFPTPGPVRWDYDVSNYVR